jgi:hypothetical protein
MNSNRIYEMELRLNTPENFRFPEFEILQYYAARYYSRKLKRLNEKAVCVPQSLQSDLRCLYQTLRKWLKNKKVTFWPIHQT